MTERESDRQTDGRYFSILDKRFPLASLSDVNGCKFVSSPIS